MTELQDLPLLEEQEQLYGAAEFSPGTFHPVPIVAVDGQDVASGTGGDGLMVVDGLSVTWGRDDVLDQPEPATGKLTLFDASKTWATRADRRGSLVTIRYDGVDPTFGHQTAVFFRGRIGAPITVSPKTVVDPATGQTVRGSLVELPLQSILVDLGNDVPTAAFPAETMCARLDRLAALAATSGVCTGGVTMRPFWRDPGVAPVAAKDQDSVLDQLTAVYDSSGADRLTYIPNNDSMTFLVRRDYPLARGVAGLWWDGNDPDLARGSQGAYIRTHSLTPVGGSASTPLYLDAATLEYDPSEGITTPPRFTRAAMAHPDSAASYETRNTEIKVQLEDGTWPDETVHGVRVAKYESLVAWNAFADVGLSDQAYFVRREGSRWVLAPLVLSTRRTGGFETANQGIVLLGGFERNSTFFLQRSWLPAYGIRPVFGVMGGTIAYSQGGWDLEFALAPITTTQKQHAITWEEIDDGSTTYELQWHDGDHTRGLHESVTYEDMAYCSTGLNVSTVPPDTGWDS
jgi:hypothetical protein